MSKIKVLRNRMSNMERKLEDIEARLDALEINLPLLKEADEIATRLRDDNDAQLDDVYPEDAPHQSEYEKHLEEHHYDEEHSNLAEAAQEIAEQEAREDAFKGLNPSPEIQAIIDAGNKDVAEAHRFPETDDEDDQ